MGFRILWFAVRIWHVGFRVSGPWFRGSGFRV